jgi:hypothetical protein
MQSALTRTQCIEPVSNLIATLDLSSMHIACYTYSIAVHKTNLYKRLLSSFMVYNIEFAIQNPSLISDTPG